MPIIAERVIFSKKGRSYKIFQLSVAFFLSFSTLLGADETEKINETNFRCDEINIDLRNPIYSDGILSTTEGGVISGPGIRIQALSLEYTKKDEKGIVSQVIEAEKDLIVDFGEYTFIGRKLVYDVQSKEGVIFDGTTASEAWFFGGKELRLRPDGSYLIFNGYVTTSERKEPDWGIYSDSVFITENRDIQARDVRLRFLNSTVLWIPSWRARADSIFDSPIRYRFRLGGRQGPRFGITYEILSLENWKTFVRFDYRLTRGPGAGVETRYRSTDRRTEFRSINYLSKDSSILHLHEKARYRFEGNFRKFFPDDKTTLLVTYDKISDKDMPNCYYDRDFFIETAYRTQLLLRRQEENWIGNFYCRARINGFQTVKEELPTLSLNIKPFSLRGTGIVFENKIDASYLDFRYSNRLVHTRDYRSTRFYYLPTFYRPFKLTENVIATPEAGAIYISYGNTPDGRDSQVIAGKLGANVQTRLYRYFGDFKHVIEPYAFYRLYTSPGSSPRDHYIFDIRDGITRLNYLSFGVKQAVYRNQNEFIASRIFSANIYTYAFFDTRKLKHAFPRIYGDFTFLTRPTVRHTVNAVWNLDFKQLDSFNFRTEWTLSRDFAVTGEYRHRGPYSWRKVDPQNYFMDMFHGEKRLRRSAVSDRRDTLLLGFFYRFHPDWACEFTSRQGWNRRREPNYTEYEIDFLTTIQTAWNLRFSYQHQQNDDRVAVYMTVGLAPPKPPTGERKAYFFN